MALQQPSAAEAGGVAQDMQAYYARRAAYYERVYFKPERQTDLRAMEAWLPPLFAGRRVLEVACGTGWWTPHGARDALHWLATDINPETMAVARAKALPACVELATADAYAVSVPPPPPPPRVCLSVGQLLLHLEGGHGAHLQVAALQCGDFRALAKQRAGPVHRHGDLAGQGFLDVLLEHQHGLVQPVAFGSRMRDAHLQGL